MSERKNERLEGFVGERELRQCEICGAMTRNWQEHHYDYQKKPNATVILCLKCHNLADERRRKREVIEVNRPEPPEIPSGLDESLVGVFIAAPIIGFVVAAVLWFLVFLFTLDVWKANVSSGIIFFLLCFVIIYNVYEEKKKKREKYEIELAEYRKRFAECERGENRQEG